jgi:hypothetical protein
MPRQVALFDRGNGAIDLLDMAMLRLTIATTSGGFGAVRPDTTTKQVTAGQISFRVRASWNGNSVTAANRVFMEFWRE